MYLSGLIFISKLFVDIVVCRYANVSLALSGSISLNHLESISPTKFTLLINFSTISK